MVKLGKPSGRHKELFVVELTMLSLGQTVQCSQSGRLINS
jgi:hypothetical protein